MSTDWDAFFAWLARESPQSHARLPLADYECSKCGRLDCDCFEQDLRRRLAHGGGIASARALRERLS